MSEERQHYLTPKRLDLTPQGLASLEEQWMRLHPQDLEAITYLVRREVQNALHPTLGTVDVKHFLTVEATDETGKRWKGVLYGIDEEKE